MCEHKSFKVQGSVNRLAEKEGGPIVAYRLDVEVWCTDCQMPFIFQGLPIGYDVNKPTLNVDQTELRTPIKPVSDG